ncbi:MAG: 50S ribosomal protein L24e [Candidatus Bathyarchaeota archaeon]|nr:50S ribosomal protein L24e [Candidatus Bathyarchaeota archaeon]
MPRIYKCSFCGIDMPPSTGLAYIRNDGSILYFCSTKCRKCMLELKRDPRKLKWTQFYGKEERQDRGR